MTVKEFLKCKEGRVRCDNRPHSEFLEELTTRKVHSLMREVMSWKDNENSAIAISYRDYTEELKMKISDIPEEVLKRMYGSVFYGENKKIYIYNSCCN